MNKYLFMLSKCLVDRCLKKSEKGEKVEFLFFRFKFTVWKYLKNLTIEKCF